MPFRNDGRSVVVGAHHEDAMPIDLRRRERRYAFNRSFPLLVDLDSMHTEDAAASRKRASQIASSRARSYSPFISFKH